MRSLARSLALCLLLTACPQAPPTDTQPRPPEPSAAPPSPSPEELACTIEGSRTADDLRGTEGDDVICGGGGNDTLRGAGGDDVLRGGPGNDTLAPGPGDDALDGSTGLDTADYAKASGAVQVQLRAGTVTGQDGTDRLASTEQLIGSRFADTVTGSPDADRIDAGGGNDVLRLGAGDDRAMGGDGNDRIAGAEGVDLCVQGAGTGSITCEKTWTAPPLARVGNLTLYHLAGHELLVGFHESLFRSAAPMKPLGRDWMLQPSRGRGTPRTSAVDIALDRTEPVYAPVDGTVTAVLDYQLYCEGPDTLIAIRPTDDPKVTVMVFHLIDVAVKKGDAIYAGGSVIGKAHAFEGTEAQITNYVPGSPPHVHVEVEADGSRAVPGCGSPGDRR